MANEAIPTLEALERLKKVAGTFPVSAEVAAALKVLLALHDEERSAREKAEGADLDRLEKVAEAALKAWDSYGGFKSHQQAIVEANAAIEALRPFLSLISSLRQATADLAEAREGLKVFGDRAAAWDDLTDEGAEPLPDDTTVCLVDLYGSNEGFDLTVGDFRRARALSSPGQNEGASEHG